MPKIKLRFFILARLLKTKRPITESPKATNVPHTIETEKVYVTNTTQFQGKTATSFLNINAIVAVPIEINKQSQNSHGLPSK